MTPNSSGALYVSSGKADADKYIKMFGPMHVSMFTNKAWGGMADTVQHITVKDDLKMPSESQLSRMTNDFLLQNKKVFNSLVDGDEAFMNITYDPSSNIDTMDEAILRKIASDPDGKMSRRVAYGVSNVLGNPRYTSEAKEFYEYVRKNGYDAIPDLHDRYNGATETATIIINPNKVECTSTTTITKNVINSGAKYIKNVWDLPLSEVLK